MRQTCTTKKTDTTVFENIHGSGAALSPVQLKTGSSSEQNVDAVDKKLTDSLWAVASNRDREHQETRQATQVMSAELIDKAQNEIAQLMEEEQYPGQNPRNTSSTQWRWNSPTPSTRREKSVDGLQAAQCWMGHEAAKLFQIIMKTERVRSSSAVNHVTEQIKTPRFGVQ